MDNLPILLNDLYYLGSRNYIQGGTIYESLMPRMLQIFPIMNNLSFTFRSIVQKDIIFFDKQQNIPDVKIVFGFEYEREFYKFYAYHQKESQFITKRIPYDDEDFLVFAKMDNDSVCLESFPQNMSIVRLVIAMNKKLLNFLFADNIKGQKWFLSQLTLKEVIDEGNIKEVKLKYISKFEFKIVKTEIFINQISVGFIYFSLKGSDYVS